MISLLEALVLVTAISIDAFVASFAYGTNKIKLPAASVAILSVISSAVLAVSLWVGNLIRPCLPSHITGILCFTILFVLGILKLFDSSIKALIRKRSIKKKLRFSFFHLNFILSVYARPEEADCDRSKSLSPGEAVPLALALSLDGLAVGFGAALAHVNSLEVILCSLLVNAAAVVLGSAIGNKVAEKTNMDLSWIGGALLLVLAFLKLK